MSLIVRGYLNVSHFRIIIGKIRVEGWHRRHVFPTFQLHLCFRFVDELVQVESDEEFPDVERTWKGVLLQTLC